MDLTIWLLALVALFALPTVLIVLWRANKRERSTQPVAYTHHARQRMTERGVTDSEVNQVLRNPERVVPDKREGSIRLERVISGNLLKVWVVEPWPTSDEIVIKSVAWSYRAEFTIPTFAIGHVIGRKGAKIRALEAETGARIRLVDNLVQISGGSAYVVSEAERRVRNSYRAT